MDDDEFAENITLPVADGAQTAAARTGTSGAGCASRDRGAGRAASNPGTSEDPQKPPMPAGPSLGPWRATPRKSSSSSSTSFSSELSLMSQNIERDLLDGTTTSEVPGESFLLTPPGFKFNEPHVDAPIPMDTTTPGPSKAATAPLAQSAAGPSPGTGTIRKRSHGATPFGTKGVVRRSESQTPILDRSVVIPVEGIPQEYLDRYSRVFRTPRVLAKNFIQEEEVQLPGYDTMMEEDRSEPPTPPDNLSKDPTYKRLRLRQTWGEIRYDLPARTQKGP